MIVNTSHDVHPPVFYLIFKFFNDTFTTILPNISSIIVGKFVAVFAFIAIYYFAIYKLSKYYSKFAVGAFLLILFSFPCLNDISLLARMYGIGVLFVLCTLYFAIKIMKFGRKQDYALFVLFFELAAYTHNFALVAVSGLYLYLFIYFLATNRKQIKKLLLCGVACFVLYLPWLVVLLHQFASIHDNYWITGVTIEVFNHVFCYDIFPVNNKILGLVLRTIICVVCMFIEFIVCLKVLLCKEIDKEAKWQAFAGIFATAFLYLFGIVVSMIVDPIFEKRYSSVIFGIYHISFLQVLVLYYRGYVKDSLETFVERRKHKSSLVMAGMLTIVVAISYVATFNVANLFINESHLKTSQAQTCEFIKTCNADKIIFDDGCDYEIAITAMPKANYFVFEDAPSAVHLDEVFGEKQKISYETLSKELMGGGRFIVMLTNSKNLEVFESYNIHYRLIGKYLWEDIYDFAPFYELYI